MLQTSRLRQSSAAENIKLTQLYVLIEGRTLTRLGQGGHGGGLMVKAMSVLDTILYCGDCGPVILSLYFLCGDCGAVQLLRCWCTGPTVVCGPWLDTRHGSFSL